MKSVLNFLSPQGSIARRPYWLHVLGAGLVLGLGQMLSLGANCLLKSEFQHISIGADLVGLGSVLTWPITTLLFPLFDTPAEQALSAGAQPWAWAAMGLGWAIAYLAAWRSVVLGVRRLRDVGASRVYLLLPYLVLPLELALPMLGLLALFICEAWLFVLYCRPGKAAA